MYHRFALRGGLAACALTLAFLWQVPANAAAAAYIRLPSAPALPAGFPVSCFVEAGQSMCAPTAIEYGYSDDTAGSVALWVNGQVVSCTNRAASTITPAWLQKRRVYLMRIYKDTLPCSGIDRTLEPALATALASLRVAPIERPRAGVGGNIFSLASVYLGWHPTESVPQADASEAAMRKDLLRMALDDAQRAGLSFVRFAPLGYGPTKLAAGPDNLATEVGLVGLWYSQRGHYWAAIQSAFDDLHARNLRAVPSINWTIDQFVLLANHPAIQGSAAPETTRDLLTRTTSRSYSLLRTYLRELAIGYADSDGSFLGMRRHPATHFYETGNELGNQADLNRAQRCATTYAHEADTTPYCGHMREFSTAEMIAFHTSVARELKRIDPFHMVSSGNAIPRPNAEHLRRCPEWMAPTTCAAPRWANDTLAEFGAYLADTHKPFDVVSVHYYARVDGSQNRFCVTDCDNLLGAGFIDHMADLAASIRRPLFIGEFSDMGDGLAAREAIGAETFSANVLARISARSIPYAAVWTWEDAFFSSRVDYPPMWSIARTPASVAQLRAANTSLGFAPVAAPRDGNDVTPPSLVLTWPREGEVIQEDTLVHAASGDDSLLPAQMEMLLNGQTLGTDPTNRGRWLLQPKDLEPGITNTLTVRACDAAANCSSKSVQVTLTPRPVIIARGSTGLLGGALYVDGRGFTRDADTALELYANDGSDPAQGVPLARMNCAQIGVSCMLGSPDRIEVNFALVDTTGELGATFEADGFIVRVSQVAGPGPLYSSFVGVRKDNASQQTPVIASGQSGTGECRDHGPKWYWYCFEFTGTGFAPDATVLLTTYGERSYQIGEFRTRPVANGDGTQTVRIYLHDELRHAYQDLYDSEGLIFLVRNPSDGAGGTNSAGYTF